MMMNSIFFDFLAGAASAASSGSAVTGGLAIDTVPLSGQCGVDVCHYRNKQAPSITGKEGEKGRISFNAGGSGASVQTPNLSL
jgi:hypothetical protein